MQPPETPDGPKDQSNKTTGLGRQNLLQTSSLSTEAESSPETAGSAPEGFQGVSPSTVAEGEISAATANPAKDHPSQSVRTGALESGDDPDQLMRQEQAALILGVTPRCLENWRWRGGGPRWVQISTRCIRYRRSDLIQFVEERVKTNTSDVGADAA